MRERAATVTLLVGLAVGCGARTGLLNSDLDPSTDSAVDFGGMAGAGAGGAPAAGAGMAGALVAGAAGAPIPPVRTNCQLTGDDPRVAGIKPDEVATLDGADFIVGQVKSYHWTLQTEDCDALVPNAQFTLQGVDSRIIKFQPSRPSFYHFTLSVVGVGGDQASCRLEVPVEGVGLRVELCWDTSTTTDLDLYLHNPFDTLPWFNPASSRIEIDGLTTTTANTSDASAVLRGLPRVAWGYADSPLNACNTPSFQGFLANGTCPNPRAADDNNQAIATGTTERMQLDNPSPGQRFRVMVQNFSNAPAHPQVFVYCGGERAGAFSAPSIPPFFETDNPGIFGVMWRAADITTNADPTGKVTCSTAPVSNRSAITVNDPTF